MNKSIRKLIVGTTVAATLFTSTVTYTFANQVHRVTNGDTLWKIAQEYNTNLEEIYQLNPQYKTNSNLVVGSIVTVSSNLEFTNYTVVRNDTPWLISNRFGVGLNELLRINGLGAESEIYPGQIIKIPTINTTFTMESFQYSVVKGDTPWTISQKFNIELQQLIRFNNVLWDQHIYEGQVLTIPKTSSDETPGSNSIRTNSGNSKTFITHTVVKGDDLWNISIKYGIPFAELLKTNGLTDKSIIQLGQRLRVPVYQIGVKATPGPQFGEILDWWTEAQYVVPIGKIFTIHDIYTEKKWQAKRTIGANHGDCEPLTTKDAAIMKEAWGGNYSWARRAVIVEVDGRKIAASASSMPHDIQYINNNNFTGHFDLYFLNSTRHVDGKADPLHQANVLKAGGK